MIEPVDFRICHFRSDELHGSNRLRGIHLYFIVLEVHKILGTAEISDFHIKFLIDEDVFRFDVAVGDSIAMKLFQSVDKLVKNQSSNSLVEEFGLFDNSEELSITSDFHDVVEDTSDLAISGAIHSADIEINDLHNMTMPWFDTHSDLI